MASKNTGRGSIKVKHAALSKKAVKDPKVMQRERRNGMCEG